MKRLSFVFLSLILSIQHNILLTSNTSKICKLEKINHTIYMLNTMKKVTDQAETALNYEKNLYERLRNKAQNATSSSNPVENSNKDLIASKIHLASTTKNFDTMNALYQNLYSKLLAAPTSPLAIAYQADLDKKQRAREEHDKATLDAININSYQPDILTTVSDIKILDEIISSSKSSPSNQSHTSSASIGKRSFAEMNESTNNRPVNSIDRKSLQRAPKKMTRYCNEDEDLRKLDLLKKIKNETSL